MVADINFMLNTLFYVLNILEPIISMIFEYIQKKDTNVDVYLKCLDIVVATRQGQLVSAVFTVLEFLRELVKGGCVTDQCLDCVVSVISAVKIAKTDDQGCIKFLIKLIKFIKSVG